MSIGVDIVFIPRFERVLKKYNIKFLQRFLHDDEIKLCLKKCDELNFENLMINRVSSFWAIKEAFSKSLGVGIGKKLNFKDIKIYKDKNNKSNIDILFKNSKKSLKKKFKIKKINLSVSHDGDYAIAYVALKYK